MDKRLNSYANDLGGYYYRYSDDILIILPGDEHTALNAETFVNNELNSFSEHLKLSTHKTEIALFEGGEAQANLVHCEGQNNKHKVEQKHGISYLGFRYDGASVFLRESTITNLRRKTVRACKAAAYNHVARFNGKSLAWLTDNLDENKLQRKFLRIENYGKNYELPDINPLRAIRLTEPQRNFLSYLKRAEDEFSDFDARFTNQIRDLTRLIRDTTYKEIKRHYKKSPAQAGPSTLVDKTAR